MNGGPVAHQRNIIGVASDDVLSNNIAIFNAVNTVMSGNYIGVGVDGHTVLPITVNISVKVDTTSGTLIGCDGNGSWDDCRNVIVNPGNVKKGSDPVNQ